jgi:hypothetical protein
LASPLRFRRNSAAACLHRSFIAQAYFPQREPRASETQGNLAKMTASRSKAEARYAEIQKREHGMKQALDNETRLRLEKTARLRQLRLAKEAEDAAAKQAAKDIKTAGKSAFKKPRASSEA